MPAQNLRILTPIVTAMVVIDALWQPLILFIARLFPAVFSANIAPIASTVDGAALAFKLATMVLFASWIYVAGRNLENADIEDLEFTPSSRIWWFAVPIASLFKPFQGMRELWNASCGVWPYDTNQNLVSTWWGLWLAANFTGYITAAIDRESQSVTGSLISSAIDIAVAVVAIMLIRGIARAQSGLDQPELADVFA